MIIANIMYVVSGTNEFVHVKVNPDDKSSVQVPRKGDLVSLDIWEVGNKLLSVQNICWDVGYGDGSTLKIYVG